MARINLLPWRDERREEQRKEFYVILGMVAAAGLVCVLLGHLVLDAKISGQEARNNYLTSNIRQLDEKVDEIKELKKRRSELLDRMRVIQDLQGNRPLIVRIFDEVVRVIPEGVFFKSLNRKGETLTVLGVAESNNRVSSLMRNLDSSDWFRNPNLKAVRAAPSYGEQANEFDMKAKIAKLGGEEETEDEG